LNQVEKARVMEKRAEKKRKRDARAVERGERETVAAAPTGPDKEKKKRAFRQRTAVEQEPVAQGGQLERVLGSLF
jgi:hypothetical protein